MNLLKYCQYQKSSPYPDLLLTIQNNPNIFILNSFFFNFSQIFDRFLCYEYVLHIVFATLFVNAHFECQFAKPY